MSLGKRGGNLLAKNGLDPVHKVVTRAISPASSAMPTSQVQSDPSIQQLEDAFSLTLQKRNHSQQLVLSLLQPEPHREAKNDQGYAFDMILDKYVRRTELQN